MKLPPLSKKTYSILVILVLLIGIVIGSVLVLGSKDSQADISWTDQLSSFFSNSFQINQSSPTDDFDNDGMSDEDEKNYGTDWRNPDTDGDGYMDGEEIAAGYDPLRPAPGDELEGVEIIRPRPLPSNLTVALEKAMSGSMELGKLKPLEIGEDVSFLDGGQLDKAIDDELAHALTATAREFGLQEIEDREIRISEDNSPQAIEAFSTLVMEALADAVRKAQRRGKAKKSELEALTEAIDTGNFSDLDIYIASFENGYSAVKEIEAPSSWKELHKKHLSILQAHSKILKAVRDIDNDPLKATIALQQYQSIIDASFELAREGVNLVSQIKE